MSKQFLIIEFLKNILKPIYYQLNQQYVCIW